ncbi:hypothetical protein NAEGRDRAFT_80039 [Naegleria gruberi]|uniref:Clustered mitochondria protein homolog n=1 Tax=Naegleria gruberi TaxID=5762 RepID=D2VI22_NAEGR|nr:uncharacterized protein NAEGRDRAFT_80039 [Naegleria gruberi]EFC43515.1 hypothetical protein NAEGRDRAFT_80039 [Naegleria gruberi]|eukprot:XP_002676259.1 hypothetical protein NAEGRDRAFT_80039 [Naegleria gruberi strain NEG-M]
MEKEQQEQEQPFMEAEVFSVFIKTLTGSKLKLQITKGDSTLEIKQLLAECVETSYITSYEFTVKGKTLDDFSDIADYPEIKDGVEINMHTLPYDNKSARTHVYRLRELLYSKIDDLYLSTGIVHSATKNNQHSFPSFFSSVNSELYNDLGHALNCDLEFLQLEGQTLPSHQSSQSTNTDSSAGETKKKKKKKVSTSSSKIDRVELKTVVMNEEENGNEGNSDEKKPNLTNKISVVELPQTPEEFNTKNLYDADSFKIGSLEPLIMLSNTELPKCVKSITFSAWNPVPEHRKIKGDLFYLQIETLENAIFHITATPSGFYVNATKGIKFNPLPSSKPHKNQTLLGLICDISPLFRATFPKLLSSRIKKHPFEVTPVPFHVRKWINIEEKHEYDPNRAEESFFTMLGTDPRIQQREWNEEYQNCKELPSGAMDERLIRDRTLFKIHCDFVDAAVKGAKAVVDKSLSPINPTDKKSSHVYIQNNIFFSFSINTDEPKDENDMDQYAYENANNDLKGVIAFNEADVPGVHTLASAIVDYRGYRVVAQSIIPGILQGDQGSKHVYGSIDEGKSFVTDPKYHSLMKEAAEKLHIKEHTIIDESGKEHTILCPSECKGIVGSDGRFYVLDLISITPRDTNFLENKIAIFRPELIQSYVTTQKKRKQQEKKEETEEKKEETKKDELVIAFNTDIHSNTKLGGSQEVIDQDIQEVQKLGKFLLEFLLPKFVQSFKLREENPFDGRTLTDAMHERGINMRYLGKIAELAKEHSVPHLIMMCKQEMITRAAKHIYNKYLRSVEDSNLATFISKFLCCIFGTNVDEHEPNKKDKKALEETDITQATLFSLIKERVKTHYRFELEDDFITKFKTIATVRSFCMKIGLQILLREYQFNTANPFNQNDILSLEPVVKHSTPRSKTAHSLLDVGRQQLTKGNFEMAFEFLSQAIIMFQQVKGPMNNEVATCFSFLATILFNASDLPQSFLHQHNALLISRRVMGLDSATISQIHSLLGLLCFNVGQAEFALKHFLRARYIHVLCCGFDHPDLAHIMLNIAMMYQDMGDMQRSLKYLHECLRIYNATLGENSDQSATTLHAIAMTYNFLRQYKNAVTFERKNYLILKEKYGENDPKVKESEQWFEHFTGRAVAVERELKQGEQEAMKLWNLQQSMGNGQAFSKKPPVEILNLLKEDQQILSNLINPPPQTTPSSTSTTTSKKKSK